MTFAEHHAYYAVKYRYLRAGCEGALTFEDAAGRAIIGADGEFAVLEDSPNQTRTLLWFLWLFGRDWELDIFLLPTFGWELRECNWFREAIETKTLIFCCLTMATIYGMSLNLKEISLKLLRLLPSGCAYFPIL